MDSLIGPLPDDWTAHRLEEVSEVQAGPSGASLPSREFSERGIPLVRPGNIDTRRVSATGLVRLPHALARRLHRYRLRAGDIVGTRTGTLGAFALVGSDHEGSIFSTQLLRVRPNDRVDPDFLLQYLTLPTVRDWIGRHTSGSTVRSITATTLRSLPTPLPPHGVQQSIGDSLRALDDKARLHFEISRTTSELRDALAPLLFSQRVAPARARS